MSAHSGLSSSCLCASSTVVHVRFPTCSLSMSPCSTRTPMHVIASVTSVAPTAHLFRQSNLPYIPCAGSTLETHRCTGPIATEVRSASTFSSTLEPMQRYVVYGFQSSSSSSSNNIKRAVSCLKEFVLSRPSISKLPPSVGVSGTKCRAQDCKRV